MMTPARPTPRTGRPRKRAEPVGIKAAEHAFDVVEALARAPGPSSLKALSVVSGLEQSKLHRYLVSLCSRGLARRYDEAGLYGLGPAALSLGLMALRQLDEPGAIREAVVGLSKQLNETAFHYVWSQSGPVLVQNHLPEATTINIRLGSIAPFLTSSVGPVFLAFVPRALTEQLLAAEAAKNNLALKDVLERAYNVVGPKIRRDVVHWSDVTLIPNSEACAAPVFDMTGQLTGVIGASSLRGRLDGVSRTQFVKMVKEAAAAASRSLGFAETTKPPSID